MATRVPVKVELLKWAYYRSINKEKLHNRFSKLNEWLSGNLQPTLKQLEEFAKATSTPLGYFFLQKPPLEQLSIPHYRKIEDGMREQPSPDLIETLHTMQRRQDFMKDYFERYIGDQLDFVGCYKGNSAEELAYKIRELFDLDIGWSVKVRNFQEALKYLIGKCEKNRIMVMVNGIVGSNTHRSLSVEEFRGFVLVDDIAPLIFLNGADAKSAQIFTLIHEVAHILIGSSAVVEASPLNRVDDSIEHLCNAAAAEFLCPRDSFMSAWHTHYDDGEVYKTLGKIYKVSPLVVGRRALELQCISREEFFEFYNKYIEEVKLEQGPTSSGGDFYNTTRIRLGELFSSVVIYQIKAGNIQFTDAYKLTGLKGSTFHRYFDLLKGRGV
ncbi:ImmA/IrrE family metallo-endopeptidase [Priestia koreensis]|uniref:ImmA/IrrE family metallo-endopeptidase n=1 Tax=Priestia koreensis TaxID=284581 RepID=UPI003016AC6E